MAGIRRPSVDESAVDIEHAVSVPGTIFSPVWSLSTRLCRCSAVFRRSIRLFFLLFTTSRSPRPLPGLARRSHRADSSQIAYFPLSIAIRHPLTVSPVRYPHNHLAYLRQYFIFQNVRNVFTSPLSLYISYPAYSR